MFCKNCGTPFEDGKAFCPNCGTPVADAPVQQPAYTAPVQQQEMPYAPVQSAQNTVADPGYPQQPSVPADNSKGMSIAALVCGILGIVGSFIPVIKYFTLVLAILGMIFGTKGMKKAKLNGGEGNGLAIAGLVLGIIGTVFGGAGVICALACAGTTAGLAGGLASMF